VSEEAEEGDDAEGSPLPQGEAIGAAGAISAINDINAVGTIDAVSAADAAGAVDVVVLAGGTGRRLGGASKPDVVARGARLLDHVLTGLAALSGPSRSSCPAGSAGRVGGADPMSLGGTAPRRTAAQRARERRRDPVRRQPAGGSVRHTDARRRSMAG